MGGCLTVVEFSWGAYLQWAAILGRYRGNTGLQLVIGRHGGRYARCWTVNFIFLLAGRSGLVCHKQGVDAGMIVKEFLIASVWVISAGFRGGIMKRRVTERMVGWCWYGCFLYVRDEIGW